MLSRRSALKLAAMGVAGGFVGIHMRRFHLTGARPLLGIYDEGLRESVDFADELAGGGMGVTAFRRDVGVLWYRHLRGELTANPVPLTGLTDRIALFCLEELARDLQMKVVFRVDHERGAGNDTGFGRAMAKLARRAVADATRDSSAQKRSGPYAAPDRAALSTWIIARA